MKFNPKVLAFLKDLDYAGGSGLLAGFAHPLMAGILNMTAADVKESLNLAIKVTVTVLIARGGTTWTREWGLFTATATVPGAPEILSLLEQMASQAPAPAPVATVSVPAVSLGVVPSEQAAPAPTATVAYPHPPVA